MSQLFENFLEGVITDNPLSAGATTINSAAFANLPEVSGGNTLVIVLDPEAVGNGPEKVTITAHTASATSVTCGATSSEHAQDTVWVHALDAEWLDKIEAFYVADTGAAADLDTHEAVVDGSAHGIAGLIDADVATHEASRNHPNATTSLDGFQSAADKTKLDGIETGAEVNVLDAVDTGGLAKVGSTVHHKDYTPIALAAYNGALIEGITVDQHGHVTAATQGNTPYQRVVEASSPIITLNTSETAELTVSRTGLQSSKKYSYYAVACLSSTAISAASYLGCRIKCNTDSSQSYMAQQGNPAGATGTTPGSATVTKVGTVTGTTSVSVSMMGMRGGTVGGTVTGWLTLMVFEDQYA